MKSKQKKFQNLTMSLQKKSMKKSKALMHFVRN